MQVFDNVTKTVKDDLMAAIEKGSRLSIAAACFSIYAYRALKKQLDGIEELRFIFTSPSFINEIYIPHLKSAKNASAGRGRKSKWRTKAKKVSKILTSASVS